MKIPIGIGLGIFLSCILLACAGSDNIRKNTEATFATKKLFYMVSPEFFPGPDLPKELYTKGSAEMLRYIKPVEGRAFALATFGLVGDEGRFVTTLIVSTKDGNGLKGWNIILNRSNKGTIERKYISMANGERASMIFNDALYLVATEVSLAATEEKITPEELDRLLNPTIDYLNSLL